MKNIQKLLDNKQFKQALESAEREIYLAAYEATGRNQSVAAKLLGVSRGTFRTKLKSWGVKMPREFVVGLEPPIMTVEEYWGE